MCVGAGGGESSGTEDLEGFAVGALSERDDGAVLEDRRTEVARHDRARALEAGSLAAVGVDDLVGTQLVVEEATDADPTVRKLHHRRGGSARLVDAWHIVAVVDTIGSTDPFDVVHFGVIGVRARSVVREPDFAAFGHREGPRIGEADRQLGNRIAGFAIGVDQQHRSANIAVGVPLGIAPHTQQDSTAELAEDAADRAAPRSASGPHDLGCTSVDDLTDDDLEVAVGVGGPGPRCEPTLTDHRLAEQATLFAIGAHLDCGDDLRIAWAVDVEAVDRSVEPVDPFDRSLIRAVDDDQPDVGSRDGVGELQQDFGLRRFIAGARGGQQGHCCQRDNASTEHGAQGIGVDVDRSGADTVNVMTPEAALLRVIHCLDRSRASGFKTKAFVRALDVVRNTDADDLERRATAGTLTELDGIGDSTGRVISEALGGEVPQYLIDLENTTQVTVSDRAQPYREALRGDCHLHSTWSDGGAPVEQMAITAMSLGHEYMVQTDHSARLTIAHGLDEQRLSEQLDQIADVNAMLADAGHEFRVLSGMEVDILVDGSLDLSDEMLSRLDVVVASVHSKLRMEKQQMTERMLQAIASPHVDILGHCTGRMIGKRPPSDFDADYVFAACAQFGTAVEINCRPERLDPPRELLRLAVEHDCWFTIDTDAHATGQLEWQGLGCDRAAECEVPIDRILNTMPADELLDWVA